MAIFGWTLLTLAPWLGFILMITKYTHCFIVPWNKYKYEISMNTYPVTLELGTHLYNDFATIILCMVAWQVNMMLALHSTA